MRILTSAAVATLLASAGTASFAVAADAAEPTRETVQVTRNLPSFVSCPNGVIIDATFQLTREITVFADSAGTPVRRQVHVTADGVLSNRITGESVTSSGVRIFHTDLVSLEQFTTGSNTIIHQPNGGTITLGTGRIQFDANGVLVVYTGPTDDDEYLALCDLLA